MTTMKPGDPAVRLYACEDDLKAPWCNQRIGKKCITKTGNETSPHPKRWALGRGYSDATNALQPKIDRLTAQNTDLSRRVSAAADDLISVRQTNTALEQARSAAEAQLKTALERIDELEHPPTPEPDPAPETPAFVLGMAYESNTDPTPVEKRIGFVLDSRRTYHGSTASAVTVVKANIAAGRKVSSLSFKSPASWADVAAGKQDKWANDLRDQLAKAIDGTDHVIKLAINHEPENDKAPNNGGTVEGRDNWKAMQLHLAPLFDRPGFFFIVILMGMHSTRPSDSGYKVWRLDLAIPDSAAVKGVGYDLYQFRGRLQEGKTTADGWSPQEADYKAIQAFHATRPGLAWGLSETAHTEAAEAERPGLLAATQALVVKYGGTWLEWFNSNLNSTAKWEMDPRSAREKSFAALAASLR